MHRHIVELRKLLRRRRQCDFITGDNNQAKAVLRKYLCQLEPNATGRASYKNVLIVVSCHFIPPPSRTNQEDRNRPPELSLAMNFFASNDCKYYAICF